MKKLYVGNLSYESSEEDLKNLFSQAGTVQETIIIRDKFTNRAKGFGFVEMSTEEEAKKAIEDFNGKDLNGRNITVAEARPQEPRTDRGGSGGGGFNRDRRPSSSSTSGGRRERRF